MPDRGPIIETDPTDRDDEAPDTTADGFPGWLSAVSESMKVTVTPVDLEVRVHVYARLGDGPIELSVNAPSGRLRQVVLRETQQLFWDWDIRDSNHRRVRPGMYEIQVSTNARTRVGYVRVR